MDNVENFLVYFSVSAFVRETYCLGLTEEPASQRGQAQLMICMQNWLYMAEPGLSS